MLLDSQEYENEDKFELFFAHVISEPQGFQGHQTSDVARCVIYIRWTLTRLLVIYFLDD